MADLKTTQETARSSIDGSELVRLATTGANWKASLTDVFAALGGGGGSASTPQYALQFNNPLGMFDGDAVALLNPSVGMTIGGATQSGGVITAGAGLHSALGKQAVPNWIDFFVGDGPLVKDAVVVVNEIFSTATLNTECIGIAASIRVDAAVSGHVTHGVGGWFSVAAPDNGVANRGLTGLHMGVYNFETTASNSDELIAMFGESINSGADITNIIGLQFSVFNQGGGSVNELQGIYATLRATNASPVNTMRGIHISHNTVSGAATYYGLSFTGAVDVDDTAYGIYLSNMYAPNLTRGIYIEKLDGDTDVAGIEIADQSPFNPTDTYNLLSRGAKSRNLFEGYVEVKETATVPGAVANLARIFAVDNGSGKTRLMVQFGSGAAQQIAIEP